MSFRMYHPDVEATAVCPSEEAFQQSWEHLGWRRLGAAEAFASDILGRPVTDVSKLQVPELERLIRYRGHELPKGTKKDDRIKTLLSIFEGEPLTDYVSVQEEPTPGFIAGVNDPARGVDVADLPDTSGLPSEPQYITEGNS